MTARDFMYWFQGFAELNGEPPSPTQWETIKRHANLVFKHEIDPSMPDPDGKLQETHDGAKPPAYAPFVGGGFDGPYRC